MNAFLDRLAKALLAEHGAQLADVAVVLPGQRAGVHLRKYLVQRAGATLWSPEILDMGGFMGRLTGLEQGNSATMLLLLYKAYREQLGDAADTLEAFLQWAPIVLRDMSEVDAHLLDLDDLYRDLRAYHGIDAWSYTLGNELSKGQQRLLDHWKATGDLHRLLHAAMAEQRLGTSGWIARQAAALPLPEAIPWSMVWFAGLNALDPATTATIRALQQAGKAVLAWDTDEYYLADEKHEAGRFLRRSIADLGPGILPPGDRLTTLPRNLRSVVLPDPTAQARYAAQLLTELPKEDLERTTVVLADEGLLMPLLEALPDSLPAVNITMGVPISSLPVNSLVTSFLQVHAGRPQHRGYHVEDLQRLLLHTFVHEGNATATLIAELVGMQQPTVTTDQLVRLAIAAGYRQHALMAVALAPLEGRIHEAITALLAWAQAQVEGDLLATEQLFRMARSEKQLHSALVVAGALPPDARTYMHVRERLLRDERIGFYGEPLSGLQVMGFLETRAIDLQRSIVLGAKEGILPQAAVQQSFIPFDVRRTYHLPLRADGEAITAYHMYRALQGASHVTMLSDTGGTMALGEPSRFIAQWAHELVGVSNTSLEHLTVPVHYATRHLPKIRVAKDPAVLKKLRTLAERGFSPSALGTFLRCPLNFYFTHILRIDSREVEGEKLGSDVLGNAVHGVFQDLLANELGKPMDPELMREWAASFRDRLAQHLRTEFPEGTVERGHFRLRIDMAAQATADHLLAEADRCAQGARIIPVQVEQDLSAPLPNGTVLRGRCDRIDDRDGEIHILDLKTGSVKENALQLKGLDREHLTPDHRYALQLVVYAWLYLQQNPTVDRVKAGIIPLQRASRSEGLYLSIVGEDFVDRSMMPAITALLSKLTAEIADVDVPFEHDPESLYCACCVA